VSMCGAVFLVGAWISGFRRGIGELWWLVGCVVRLF
jgi:hypothetical protein